jgi:peptidoglycan/xylan/chitin deacetylase (PgdA/CDA1 family)
MTAGMLSAETFHEAKQRLIGAGFAMLKATGVHSRFATHTRGQGAILTFHHVRPWDHASFAPNRLLEITPQFLDAALHRAASLGFEVVSLDEALERIARPSERPFLVLTFDDGYRDTLHHALPVLERHNAPFTLYATTGFVERTARLWWIELADAIGALETVALECDKGCVVWPTASVAQKRKAFRQIYWRLRAGPEDRLLSATAMLMAQAGRKAADLPAALCLDRAELARLAAHHLCTIGAHTLTHPMLAKHEPDVARHEMAESGRLLRLWTGQPVRHLSFPVGDPTSAGPREFALARDLGFASAVTTRPGMIFPDHAARLTALPRLSVNGLWQNLDDFEVLLSGAPFALWNRGRKVAA